MQVGICLPYSEPGITRKMLVEWCRAIEDGPFGAISCGERISGADAMEMRAMITAAGLLTSRVRIVPTLYVLPMHDAVWAAKEVATLDVLTEGRVDVVVGTGGRPGDYRAVGADWATRNQRLPEQVATMRRTWAGELPFEGSEPIGPKPVKTPRIIGGFAGPKAIAGSAKWSDGLYAFSITGEAGEVKQKLDWYDGGWKEVGKKNKPWKIGGFWYSLAANAEAALRKYTYDYMIIAGHELAAQTSNAMTMFDPGRILDAMRAMKATGIDELYMVPASIEIAEVKKLADLVAKI